MTIQVLISTVDQTDYTLLSKMNIKTDAIVVNQTNYNSIKRFTFNNNSIIWVNMDKRGIGLSRNTALMYSNADIVLFADDDMTYNDDYGKEVIKAFETNNNADIICFNINLINSNKNIGGHRNNKKNKKIHMFNSMRYGACLIAARRKVLLKKRICFSLLFGGGAEFNSGEDSIFVKDCLDAGLNLYSNIYTLGNVDDSDSSWYKGINDKFFIDRGIVLTSAFPKINILIIVYYACKLSKLSNTYNKKQIFKLMIKGKNIISKYR